MRTFYLISLLAMFVMPPIAAHAREEAPLGSGTVALKVDYIVFTSNYFDSGFREDDGIYVGLEGYVAVAPNVYLGGEVGHGVNIDLVGEDISFVPIELNVKYAAEAAPNLVMDVGIGISGNYVELQDRGPFGSGTSADDFLFGGQVFADLTYTIRWFSIGANAKYQITEDFRDENFALDNMRVGAHIGVTF